MPHRPFAALAQAILVLFALLLTPALAFDATADIAAADARQKLSTGEMILVDVREPAEWRQTGIAEGALTLSMNDPQFLLKIMQIEAENPDKQIGFICASSRRSGLVQAELAKRGFTNTASVFGGMTGNGQVPGWIAEGLPTVPYSGN